jgi:hypothetical protein
MEKMWNIHQFFSDLNPIKIKISKQAVVSVSKLYLKILCHTEVLKTQLVAQREFEIFIKVFGVIT